MTMLRREMGRTLALLFLAGSAFAVIALALPHPSGSYIPGVWAVAVGAALGAAFFAVAPTARMPVGVFHAALFAGTLFISAGIYWWRPGEVASSVALILVALSGYDGVTGMISALFNSVRDAVLGRDRVRYGSFVPEAAVETNGKAHVRVRLVGEAAPGSMVRLRVRGSERDA